MGENIATFISCVKKVLYIKSNGSLQRDVGIKIKE
jgi:hypothetical protein